jgi:phospholipid/cholesterol/gamma-HCH transport system substrate-binding protein
MSPTARVGVFMLVALAIIGVFIIKIEEIPIGTKGGRQRIQVEFSSVAGLDEKAAVRVAGVRVGIVERIDLVRDHARVTLAFEREVKLHEGATAQVSSLGLLGDKYIELDPGPLSAPPLTPGTVLQGSSPVGFDQLLKTGSEIGGDIKAVTASLRASLGGPEGEKRLNDILDNIRDLTAQTRALVAANRVNVDATLQNFREFSETLKTDLPAFADKLIDLADRLDNVVAANRGNIDQSIANIKDVSARLRTSADNINEITGKIARGEGSIGKLVNEDKTVNNLNSALESVKTGVESLRNTIGRPERWHLFVNLRSEALPGLHQDRNSRSAFGIDLHTTPQRFFRLELVDSPFGREQKQTLTSTVTYPDGHQETTVTSVDRVTDVSTVNAQVGYLFHNFSLRAGLFESKGGVGIDRDMLKNRLRLTVEAYDFGRSQKPPHLRFEGRYFITHNLFAYAGWDDPTLSHHSSVLFGGGVTWSDEDLKYLMGTAASLGR